METTIQVLDKEETQAWRALLRANSTLVNKIDRALEDRHNLGLPDYEVLTHLASAGNRSLRMTELAREVLLSPSGLTRRLDSLVKGAYVERRPCPSDGRGLLAVITPSGENKLLEMTPTYATTIREHFLNCLSREQIQNLTSALEMIADYDETCPSPRTGTDLTRAEPETANSH